MAERRMFAKTIVLSDAFLDMPMTARCLYFTLGMLADDDGFVNAPKSIMRQCGATQDDFMILLQKRYVLGFESGVIVIKHWRINNYLQSDRHNPTTYKEELAMLELDEKKAYIEKERIQIPETSSDYVEVEEQPPVDEDDELEGLSDESVRAKAYKDGDIPYSFGYKIRNAFAGKKCPVCGHTMLNYLNSPHKPTIQHNTPISKGGKHELSNISVICRQCNVSVKNEATGPLNNADVVSEWEKLSCIQNDVYTDSVYTDKYSIDKNSIGKGSIGKYNSTEPSDDSVLTMTLNDGSEYPITQKYIDEMQKLYPAVDVMQELRSMKAWCINNPTKLKTRNGI
ncbi:MAG: HNH endonuclease, partial [Lachnospiraceae bacterium]|nr:HNH endonuclease [Lachnospiraceae bacterium]